MKFFLRVIDWSGLKAHALRLRARSAWHFCAVGTKMPNVLIAACVTQGVALGYGQQLGFQPAPNIIRLYNFIYVSLRQHAVGNVLAHVVLVTVGNGEVFVAKHDATALK